MRAKNSEIVDVYEFKMLPNASGGIRDELMVNLSYE